MSQGGWLLGFLGPWVHLIVLIGITLGYLQGEGSHIVKRMGQKGWSGEELHWTYFCTKGKQLTATLITGLLLLVQKGGGLMFMKSFYKYFVTQSEDPHRRKRNFDTMKDGIFSCEISSICGIVHRSVGPSTMSFNIS